MPSLKSFLHEYGGDREFYGKVFRIAVPISLQQMITVGINLMDTIMLSSMGDAQLSASSLAGQFVNLFQICCMGIGMGASVLTARFWGLEDLPALRKAVTIMLRFCAAFSADITFNAESYAAATFDLSSNPDARALAIAFVSVSLFAV